jgi:hypothetical protein
VYAAGEINQFHIAIKTVVNRYELIDSDHFKKKEPCHGSEKTNRKFSGTNYTKI